MENEQKFIGIFDSGIGGLTVAKQLIKKLPSEKIIYLGDTARVPYGIKSKDTVLRFAKECVGFLSRFDLKALVIACNTVSSYALSELKTNLDLPVLGVISPGVKKAVSISKKGRIGVIGTRATINSEVYKNKILKQNKKIKVFQQSCSLFVSLAEEGWIKDEITYKIAERYLAQLRQKGIDTLILGCTHYPILKDVIGDVMGNDVVLIDSAEEVAEELKLKLKENDILSSLTNDCNRFFVTDEAQRFIDISELFFGMKLDEVSQVDLSNSKIIERIGI